MKVGKSKFLDRFLLANYRAGLHYEAHVLEGGDVFEGVAGDGDYVGVEAGFQLADLGFPTQESCAFYEVGLQDGQWLHAIADHQFKFAGLRAVRERAYIGANGEGDAGGYLLFELGDLVVE
jgi:hypothetical protein